MSVQSDEHLNTPSEGEPNPYPEHPADYPTNPADTGSVEPDAHAVPDDTGTGRENDGTVADFDPKGELPRSMAVAAFNERDDDTMVERVRGEEVDSPVATFRSATGHDYSEPDQ